MSETSQLQGFEPSAENLRNYRNALGLFGTGVTIVTANSSAGPIGITANSFSSVSLDPPLVLWSLARHSRRFAHFAEVDNMAIHILGADQTDLCHRFASDAFSFDDIDWQPGQGGTPLIQGSLACFECRIKDRHDGGDHEIIVSRVMRATTKPCDPLLVFGGKFGGFAG